MSALIEACPTWKLIALGLMGTWALLALAVAFVAVLAFRRLRGLVSPAIGAGALAEAASSWGKSPGEPGPAEAAPVQNCPACGAVLPGHFRGCPNGPSATTTGNVTALHPPHDPHRRG
jgi:hypothetical protein